MLSPEHFGEARARIDESLNGASIFMETENVLNNESAPKGQRRSYISFENRHYSIFESPEGIIIKGFATEIKGRRFVEQEQMTPILLAPNGNLFWLMDDGSETGNRPVKGDRLNSMDARLGIVAQDLRRGLAENNLMTAAEYGKKQEAKPEEGIDLEDVIAKMVEGEIVLLDSESNEGNSALSKSEKKVLAYFGFAVKETAERLGLKDQTIKRINGHIFNKLNVRDRVSVIIKALEAGEIKISDFHMKVTNPERYKTLLTREIEILDCISEGMNNDEIAKYMKMSGQTVKNSVYNIFLKLGVHSRAEAAIYNLQILSKNDMNDE